MFYILPGVLERGMSTSCSQLPNIGLSDAAELGHLRIQSTVWLFIETRVHEEEGEAIFLTFSASECGYRGPNSRGFGIFFWNHVSDCHVDMESHHPYSFLWCRKRRRRDQNTSNITAKRMKT